MYEVTSSEPPLREVPSLLQETKPVVLDVSLAAKDIAQRAELHVLTASEVPGKLGSYAICGTLQTESDPSPSNFRGVMVIKDKTESAALFMV